MKFKKLTIKLDALYESNEAIDPKMLEGFKQSLIEKKAKYTRKLKKGIGPIKRDATEAKLEQVQIHLKKVKGLLSQLGTECFDETQD